MMLFLWSLAAGLIIGAPVGVAGALVADSALTHNIRRMLTTILGVALGDTTLAFVIAYFTDRTEGFVNEYQADLWFFGGFFLLFLGAVMGISAYRGRNRALANPSEFHGPLSLLVSRAGPAVAAFAVALFHPGSILVMIPVCRGVMTRVGDDAFHPWVFALAIGIGSLTIFAFSAFLFWKIRQMAGKFVVIMRFSLAGIILSIGVYFICKYYHQQQESAHVQSSSIS